jgi:non-ribosomal peptide synthetase component F
MFVLQNTPIETLSLPGVTVETVSFETISAKFDVTLSISERDGGLSGTLEFAADLFDAGTARELARAYETILDAVAAHPDIELLSIPLGEGRVPMRPVFNDQDFAFGEV